MNRKDSIFESTSYYHQRFPGNCQLECERCPKSEEGRREREIRNPENNRRSQSQTVQKKQSEEGKSALQRNLNTPIRNASEPSVQHFWAESSDKGLSAQYLRPNFQPIYHFHGRAYSRRRPCALLEALLWALLGHCARVWPRRDGLGSPGTRCGSFSSRRHDG